MSKFVLFRISEQGTCLYRYGSERYLLKVTAPDYQSKSFERASGKETAVAGTTVEDADCTFTVRWCGQTANVGTTSHRIIFKDEIYNIIAVDHMNYKKKCIKFRCRKARR